MTTTEMPPPVPPPASAPEPAGGRRPRTARWVALFLAVVMVALLVVLATREPAQNTLARSPLVGKQAPELTGTALDGSTIRLSVYRGRFVLVNFFASWCIPCLREHDDLIRFSEAHRSAGDAQVISVIFDDEPDNARRFFARHGGDWPVVEDPSGRIALEFGVRGPPESFLIAPDGTVLVKILGEVNDVGLARLLRRAGATS